MPTDNHEVYATQDERHGDADRLADSEHGAMAGEPAIHARTPRGKWPENETYTARIREPR